MNRKEFDDAIGRADWEFIWSAYVAASQIKPGSASGIGPWQCPGCGAYCITKDFYDHINECVSGKEFFRKEFAKAARAVKHGGSSEEEM